MKKLITIIFILMLFIACKKEPTTPTLVKVSLNYGFNQQSASMYKSMDSDYTDFYNKYIVGRLLTPYSYNLTFTGSKGNVLTINGIWKANELFTLPTDKYIVSGKSYPTATDKSNYLSEYLCQYMSDTCYINISDTLTVDKNTTKLTLKAVYDCYLVLINNVNTLTTKITVPGITQQGKEPIMKVTEHFNNVFIKALSNNNSITITKKDNLTSTITLNNYPFKYGTYYYFDYINSDYTLLKMIN